MNNDHRAPVRERAEILIYASPGRVWDTLIDFRAWPVWMPGVHDVEVGEKVGIKTRFKWRAGPGTIRSEVITWQPPTAVAWSGRSLGIKAVHIWGIEPAHAGSRVVTMELWFGLIPRLMREPIRRNVRRAIDNGLRALKVEAERGQRLER